jgi:hypothetical protein
MTDIELKRAFVRDMYRGWSWKERVMKMSDAQIVAIYLEKHQFPKAKAAKRDLDNDPPLF